MSVFVADFETVNDVKDCRVWCWAFTDINCKEFRWGIYLDTFMNWVGAELPTLYFHNQKFDCDFLYYYLFENGFSYVENEKLLSGKSFTILMSDRGQLYTVVICFGNNYKGKKRICRIYDSLKLLPFSVAQMAKAFGLEEGKGEIDYNKKREIGYTPSCEEVDYIRRDVQIVAQSLSFLFLEGHNKMTIGANALDSYKKTVGKNFKAWFPELTMDSYLRKSYKGGFTYCKKSIQGKDIGEGVVFDVNSLYPWVMYVKALPYGEPIFFEGKYEEDEIYNLHISRVIVDLKLKEGHLPCLQIKGNLLYDNTEYIEETVEPTELTLTSVDLKLIQDHYEGEIIYMDGWKFKSQTGMFQEYIDGWTKVKEQATEEGNEGKRTLAKLMLNSLYGKFGVNPRVVSKHLKYEDGIAKFYEGEEETRKTLYIPIASFITAYAREKTIRSGQEVYDRFLYADTDSLHLTGNEIPENIEVDSKKLGYWKKENIFSRARFLRQKCYMEFHIKEKKVESFTLRYEKKSITCSGMTQKSYPYVTWANFHIGAVYNGHLSKSRVHGGTVLLENQFSIKEKRGLQK